MTAVSGLVSLACLPNSASSICGVCVRARVRVRVKTNYPSVLDFYVLSRLQQTCSKKATNRPESQTIKDTDTRLGGRVLLRKRRDPEKVPTTKRKQNARQNKIHNLLRTAAKDLAASVRDTGRRSEERNVYKWNVNLLGVQQTARLAARFASGPRQVGVV